MAKYSVEFTKTEHDRIKELLNRIENEDIKIELADMFNIPMLAEEIEEEEPEPTEEEIQEAIRHIRGKTKGKKKKKRPYNPLVDNDPYNTETSVTEV